MKEVSMNNLNIIKFQDLGLDHQNLKYVSYFLLSDGSEIKSETSLMDIKKCDNPFLTPQEIRMLNDKQVLFSTGLSKKAWDEFLIKFMSTASR